MHIQYRNGTAVTLLLSERDRCPCCEYETRLWGHKGASSMHCARRTCSSLNASSAPTALGCAGRCHSGYRGLHARSRVCARECTLSLLTALPRVVWAALWLRSRALARGQRATLPPRPFAGILTRRPSLARMYSRVQYKVGGHTISLRVHISCRSGLYSMTGLLSGCTAGHLVCYRRRCCRQCTALHTTHSTAPRTV